MKAITIKENDSGQRLDKFLGKYIKNMPNSLLYKYIRLKRIKINGKKSDIAYKLQVGDKVELYINDEFFVENGGDDDFKKSPATFKPLYEDDNIILADKISGLVVHEDENEKINTLINQVKNYLFLKGEYDPATEQSFAPALCNRIDRNTAGIVIIAKNAKALRIINEKIKNNEIDKRYLAIVTGTLKVKKGELRGYLFKNEKENTVYVQREKTPQNKTIITQYRVLNESNDLTLVEVKLITGRTHQIRAHFASIGHPLLGDGKYGVNKINKAHGIFTQALYSYKLTFAFTSPSDELEYLKNKTFEVKNVPFVKNFFV